ncbi:hypothetical protein CC85DRAFT_137488 [Cutaneotrichosporon oleaginosum]|uniref:Uncharacterized protein n=1 Tax=Cutaneotrichosporon oleaginosum TaxID=879819 RepID=A0A0J0XWW4_9TREE|nr:uncharacterized protein CC85DRAFT_137488 [Cutaneotrichosporon oleaginosum]KLT45557.1 hypothetical protein CC85DRAFT_137488 [Cutaneotrichosporon oleaginosum]TXT14489.1 hypothetical protein COLE_00682 [Cutaneotrichosporon oleaginosum]
MVEELKAAGKGLPVWFFTPPSDAQRTELDSIRVLGADPYADFSDALLASPDVQAVQPSLASNAHSTRGPSNVHSDELRVIDGHTEESHQSNGHTQYPPTESPRAQLPEPIEPEPSASFASSPFESGQRSLQPTPTSILPLVVLPKSASPPHRAPAKRFKTPSDDSEEDDAVPVVYKHKARRSKPLSRAKLFASSPPVPHPSSQPTGETDEEDLSDYERERRRGQKQPAPPQSASQAAESLGISEESVSKSQDSGSFNLARCAQSAPLAPSSPHALGSVPQVSSSAPIAATRVLVPTTTDESMPTGQGDEVLSPPEPVIQLPTPDMPRKRPRASGATTASGEADDEASLGRPLKRPATQADAEEKAEMKTPVKSSWEPPPGQRVPATITKSTLPAPLSIAEAVQLVLPGYKPDLTALSVPGLSRELVEVVHAKAIEEKAAQRARRRSSKR